jgi:hypothetical protein
MHISDFDSAHPGMLDAILRMRLLQARRYENIPQVNNCQTNVCKH